MTDVKLVTTFQNLASEWRKLRKKSGSEKAEVLFVHLVLEFLNCVKSIRVSG